MLARTAVAASAQAWVGRGPGRGSGHQPRSALAPERFATHASARAALVVVSRRLALCVMVRTAEERVGIGLQTRARSAGAARACLCMILLRHIGGIGCMSLGAGAFYQNAVRHGGDFVPQR